MAQEPRIKPRKHHGLCLVMSSGQMRKCGERRKDGGREWRGFNCQSRDFWLYLVVRGVFKGLFQKVLSETTFDGSVMGRLERLQDQIWGLLTYFSVLLRYESFLF